MKNFLSAIKVRFWAVLTVLHLGFIAGMIGIAVFVKQHGIATPEAALWASSLILMYGAFMLSGYFLVAPMRPVIARAREWSHMKNKMMDRMPKDILKTVGWVAVVLVVIEVIYLLVKMWRGRSGSDSPLTQVFSTEPVAHKNKPRSAKRTHSKSRKPNRSRNTGTAAPVIPLKAKSPAKKRAA